MNAVRAAMKEQLNREGLANSAIWTAAIHYNELHHIHVHIAIVEPNQLVSTKHFQTKMVQPIKQDVAVVQKALIVFVVKLPVNYLIVMNHWPEFPR